VQQWMGFVDSTWMTVAMVAWIALIASVGYVAVFTTGRGTPT
jgi:altronate dehydratase